MRFGITNLVPVGAPPEEWQRFNRAAEQAGFEVVSVGDIQTRTMEMTVSLALLAATTTTLRFGPTISNPVTRHPAVMAAAFASINRVAAGRCWLGISTGNSAVRNLGLKPSSLADLEQYVAAFRGLVNTGHSVFRGAHCELPWAPEVLPDGIRVYLAGNGPRSLELAGRIGDGVIVGGGLTNEVVERALERIEAGARVAGKQLEDLDIWFQAHIVVTASEADALNATRDVLSGAVSRNFRGSFAGKGVPQHLESAVRRFEAEYDYSAHCTDAGHNAALLDHYGLTQLAAELWLVGGKPDTVLARLKVLRSRGVENIHVAGLVPDPFELVARFGGEILPQLS